MPVQGWTEVSDWVGFIPFEDMPKVLDPGSAGWSTRIIARCRWITPWPIEGDWDAGFRAARIEDRLAEATPQTVETTAALQLDSVSLMARPLLPLMLERPSRPERHRGNRAVTELGWKHAARPSGAADFRGLASPSRAGAMPGRAGPAFDDYWDYRPRFVEVALTKSPRWCDDIGTDEVGTAHHVSHWPLRLPEELSHRFGVDSNGWRWGDAHKASFNNSFWHRIPIIGGLASTSRR